MTPSVVFETSIPTNTSVICTLLVPILATYGLQAPATVRVNGRKRRDDLDSLAGLIPRARPIYRARNNYLIHTRERRRGTGGGGMPHSRSLVERERGRADV